MKSLSFDPLTFGWNGEDFFLLMFVCFFTKMHVVLLYPCFVNFAAGSSDKLANKNAAEPSEYL